MEKRDKYDTNPLDPEYARNTEKVWSPRGNEQQTEPIGQSGATREIVRTPNEQARSAPGTEAPTRRYDSVSSSYPSVFIQPGYSAPPVNYQSPIPPDVRYQPTSRPVAGLRWPENVTMLLPYLPFHIGAVAAVIELFLVPRGEVRTRFHAAQGLALQLAALIIGFLFTILGVVSGSHFGGIIFSMAAFIFFVVSLIRVWKGEPHHITPLDDVTTWLNTRIAPRKR